jgi:S-DNA-T family DNA segregation ATPase FtsK/SpoIIIE
MTKEMCLDCKTPIDSGATRCSACVKKLRAGGGYRRFAQRRDGRNCHRCSALRNRTVLGFYGWRARRHGLADVLLARVPLERPVDRDHVQMLAKAGPGEDVHHGSNIQTLCKAHHRAKTRQDVASLHGERSRSRLRRFAWVGVVVTVAVVARLSDVGLLNTSTLILAGVSIGAVAWLTARARSRSRMLSRLHLSLAKVTGDAPTRRRPFRVKRWKRRRVTGKILPQPVPVSFELRNYPATFDDADPTARELVERRVAAKLGGTWAFTWDTEANRMRALSPDPLADRAPMMWPIPDGPVSIWDPILVAVDESGALVYVSLPESNLLIGGVPGSGKSIAQSMFTSVAALDRTVRMHLLDGKQVELSVWERCADTFVGPDIAAANRLLADMQAIMDHRYAMLRASRRPGEPPKRKIERGDGHELHVLIVDELAYFTTWEHKASREEFTTRLRDVISRGRAAGIIVLAATQRPSADVVPTGIRDLFGMSWAMRCKTPASSDMILGQGWAGLGYSAARIDKAMPGVGMLLHEGSSPVRCKAYYVNDAALARLAARAEQLRGIGPEPLELLAV